MSEGFERGAFAPAIADRGDRPHPFLDRHEGRVVGGVRFDEDDTGLHYTGRLLGSAARGMPKRSKSITACRWSF